MGNNYVISIERPAKLSINTGRLEIYFQEEDAKHYICPADIAIIILANPCIEISAAVLKEISLAGAAVLHIGSNHMPVALTLPIGINIDGAKRPHKQAQFINIKESALWWAQLVKSKILGQSEVLKLIDKEQAKQFMCKAKYVQPGDVGNIEAYCAKCYWDIYLKYLNYDVNIRQKQGATDIINVSLNYAYAIIRAMVARSLAAAGLCLNFGVGHCRKDNPFNLAEDFIEPFRFIADSAVLMTLSVKKYDIFNSELKKNVIAKILQSVVIIEGKGHRLFNGIDFAVNSFCLSLEDPRLKLLLPNVPKKSGPRKKINKEIFHIEYET